jgi:hypothetical protein
MNERQSALFDRQLACERKRRARIAVAVAEANAEVEEELDAIRRECGEIGHEWVWLSSARTAVNYGCAICNASKVEE